MLDDDSNENVQNDPTAQTPAAPRRRRAASRSAGPAAPAAEVAPAEPAPAADAGAADRPASGQPAGDQSAKQPAKRTRKKAATPQPEAEVEAAEPAAPAAEAAPAAKKAAAKKTAAKKAAPAKRTRKQAEAEAAAPTEEQPEGAEAVAAEALAPGRAAIPVPLFQAPETVPAKRTRKKAAPAVPAEPVEEARADEAALDEAELGEEGEEEGGEEGAARRRRRRRGGRGRRRRPEGGEAAEEAEEEGAEEEPAAAEEGAEPGEDEAGNGHRRRRRRRRGDEGDESAPRVRERREEGPTSVRGSTRLEAKKQRRREGREAGRRRAPILTEAEFLARRESVDRVMVVRQDGERTQIAVLEDGVLVEHYVNRSGSTSMAGNVYLGRVQNVLPSMEAAFVDIGRGRNAVLYAGEVNWDAAGLEGQPRRIELALKSGDPVLVQVTKDPVGHKGARLTSQISLPGRYLVYVPQGSMTGISRKLPDTERNRLKSVLRDLVSEDAGVIVRTAAEGASEEELTSDVRRLASQWEDIQTKAKSAQAPALLHGEPDVAIRVVRDIFNEDFARLIVAGDGAWDTIHEYVTSVAPDLAERLEKWVEPKDLFASYRIDEQLAKALDRKVWLPSGGSLVIDRTEAMTVIDVNTGKFTGQGGNLEETVTRNNLEAAEEIVRQLRLRDVGGIIVIDFIDMVLESNRDLVLRRLTECLGRDRTKHQVAEVTSLGLVQMTRKRIGQSLLDVFSEPCEHCNGRGLRILAQPQAPAGAEEPTETRGSGRRKRGGAAAASLPVQVKTGLDPVDAMRAHAHDEPAAPIEVGEAELVPVEAAEPGEAPVPVEVVDVVLPAEVTDVVEPVAAEPAATETEPEPVVAVAAPRARRSRRATTAGPIAADPSA